MQDRTAQFNALLASQKLDGYALKHACLHGAIPDRVRAHVWRCLLGVVDLDANLEPDGPASRDASKCRKRSEYYQLVNELLQAAAKRELVSCEAVQDVHALTAEHGHIQPNETARKTGQDTWLDDIDKDVRRTQTSYAFFSQTVADSPAEPVSEHRRVLFDRLDSMHPHRAKEIEDRYALSSPTSKGKGREEPLPADRHFECLIRLLYVFALLNPVHYVQGMSELVAPLYYVFSHSTPSSSAEDIAQDDANHAEADTFWAFSQLMAEIGDFYVQDSDGAFNDAASLHPNASQAERGTSKTGLGATLRKYARQLHWLDAELALDLHKRKEIQPTFYALRWITTLFAMEFPIPDLIQIWDTLFAQLGTRSPSDKRKRSESEGQSQARDFLLDISCAMILRKRGELLQADFSQCLQILQQYTCDDVRTLLTLAFNIREKRITAALEGLDLSNYASAPSTPVLGDDETDSLSPLPNASFQSARSMFTAAAGSQTAKALKSRFWKSQSREVDFPDDVSDISTATAPALLDSPATGIFARSATSSPAASLPTSASQILNKYAASLSQSDAAAALSKATTNSYITALQWRESAPTTFSKLSSDLTARVSGAAGVARTIVRPPSPHMDPPFTPPTVSTGRLLTPDGSAYGSPHAGAHVLGERRPSGPKPLLLSGAARRASIPTHPHDISPTASRRPSYSNQSGSIGLGPHPGQNGHRTRTPSPTHMMRPNHGRTASAVVNGSYKIGQASRLNGHGTHARGGSLAHVSPSRSPVYTPENPAISEDLPLADLSLGTSQKFANQSSLRPSLAVRTKAASSELEILDDEATNRSMNGGIGIDGLPTPGDGLSYYFMDRDAGHNITTSTPPLSPTSRVERDTLTDDVPLSPSATVQRRRPRTSSLPHKVTGSIDGMVEVSAKDVPPPTGEKARRKLASSRRAARQDSIGSGSYRSSASVRSTDGDNVS